MSSREKYNPLGPCTGSDSEDIALARMANELVAQAACRIAGATSAAIGTCISFAICQLAIAWVTVCSEADAAGLISPATMTNFRSTRVGRGCPVAAQSTCRCQQHHCEQGQRTSQESHCEAIKSG